MYGDFSRDTFRASKHLSRVLLQQGRVLLDADWNEQTSILLHYMQTLALDLIGPHGGPGDGFKIGVTQDSKKNMNLTIAPGHYYVDGLLCENDVTMDAKGRPVDLSYFGQSDYPRSDPQGKDKLPTAPFLVYMDVWERSLTAAEDPSIREVALGGAETAARARVVWQVKVWGDAPGGTFPTDPKQIDGQWDAWVAQWHAPNRGLMRAKGREEPSKEADPCITSPESRYRGDENQLYRVEIHKPGQVGTATFKWSRDNGALIFPIRTLEGTKATLDTLGRNDRLGLHTGAWVEIVDDDTILQNGAGPLAQITQIDDLTVTLKLPKDVTTLPIYTENSTNHPLLRRWDHQAGEKNRGGLTLTNDGAATLTESSDGKQWFTLEDGVQIQFQPPAAGDRHLYRAGDYWLIPARTAIGDVEWPGRPGEPASQKPQGIDHHYAPLAIIPAAGDPVNLRRVFASLAKLPGT